MEIPPQERAAILQCLKRGVQESSAKLAAICRTAWEIRGISLKAYARPEECVQAAEPGQRFFGACCQAPGKVFLALFSEPSAARISRSFLAGSRRSLEPTPQRQEAAVAEVANIVINAVADSLAEPGGMAIILSAPKCLRGESGDIVKASFGDFPPRGRIFSAFIELASRELAADCTLLMMLDDVSVNFILHHPEL